MFSRQATVREERIVGRGVSLIDLKASCYHYLYCISILGCLAQVPGTDLMIHAWCTTSVY